MLPQLSNIHFGNLENVTTIKGHWHLDADFIFYRDDNNSSKLQMAQVENNMNDRIVFENWFHSLDLNVRQQTC